MRKEEKEVIEAAIRYAEAVDGRVVRKAQDDLYRAVRIYKESKRVTEPKIVLSAD
jgi:hypothetical protein